MHIKIMKCIFAIVIGFLFVNTPAIAEEISLLDLPVKEYKVGFGDLWIGWFGANDNPRRVVKLHEKETKEYLFAHASSRVLYDIPSGVNKFSAWGIRVSGDDNVVGTWIYIVKIDGKEVFRSKPLADYETHEVPIDVPINSGVKEIELIIDDMKNNFCDHSIWAVPTFTK